ncbi:MAG: alcohol dehydrogenase catalytic domain-containing protein [Desulfomonile tiedjei]|uniref:Alcohol dehydrogenase catalytic domain-containing protein n=1 Tax=Desulfomonile tiedjei TaxID=2358 RepID=A0A9D6UZY2_9BACT|nr:alcohol dehydrogenase catalytic domain-containing protein [Desulfomonile tiedjei]
MKALVFDGALALKNLPIPEPRDGEALVKVLTAGICNTDLEISRGYMQFRGVIGHEFVGMVERSPDPNQVGTRVVGEINAGCGECPACRSGLQRHCPERTVLGILGRDGAIAEYLTLPVSNLVAVPQGVSDEKAVFTEPLAAALEILEQVRIRPADKVLVIGDGKLGLLVSMVLRLTGSDLLLVGKHRPKLDFFARLNGRTALLSELDATGDKFDIVVECSGNPGGWKLAAGRVKPRGVLVLKSTYHGNLEINPAPLVVDEITVVGSRCGQFAPALRLMDSCLVDPMPLISAVFPISQAEDAFRRSQESDSIKVLLKISS